MGRISLEDFWSEFENLYCKSFCLEDHLSNQEESCPLDILL